MQASKKPEVILIANVDSTFVKHDEKLLAEVSVVKKLITSQKKSPIAFVFGQLRILGFVLSNIRRSSAVFCWFADYHSYFPALISKWFNKPFYLIEGGYDTTFLPDLDYGVHTSKMRSGMVNYAVNRATRNLPVSEFLAQELKSRYGESTSIEVLHTGYSVSDGVANKKETVLMVALVDSQKRLQIKGVERYIELATLMDETRFVMVGVKNDLLKNISLPVNLKAIEYLPKNELDDLYGEAKVYNQFSLREGLPNAVLEAMAYECVVVAINHSGMAEAVGDAGYLLPEWNLEAAREMVVMAMTDPSKGKLACDRVEKLFNEEIRRTRLHELVLQS